MRCLLPALAAWTGGGCGLFGPSESPPNDVVRPEWLVEELAGALTSQGSFASIAQSTEYSGDLGRGEAEELATVFVKTIPDRPGGLGPDIVASHGAPVDFPSLRSCGKSYYMKSSFQPLSPTVQADGLRSGIEAIWQMTFCLPTGTRTVLQYLRAATHSTAPGGVLIIPSEAGGDFVSFGIPLSRPNLFRSPEAAVARVYTVTGTRISRLPELFHDVSTFGPTGQNGRPFGAYWKIEVERDVSVTTAAQGTVQSRIFYVLAYVVLFDDGIYVAGATPLPSFWVGSTGGVDSVLVIPREPLNFQRVLTSK